MMMTIADVIKQLVEAHEQGKDINLNKSVFYRLIWANLQCYDVLNVLHIEMPRHFNTTTILSFQSQDKDVSKVRALCTASAGGHHSCSSTSLSTCLSAQTKSQTYPHCQWGKKARHRLGLFSWAFIFNQDYRNAGMKIYSCWLLSFCIDCSCCCDV